MLNKLIKLLITAQDEELIRTLYVIAASYVNRKTNNLKKLDK